MAKILTKTQVIQTIASEHSARLARKDVAGVLESLTSVGHQELKKNGIFVLPGLARFVVVRKPATEERQGINPFTKQPITIKAKPGRKVLKARPVKAVKAVLV
jgi:nucleoid DNA-binding protein